MSRDWGSEPSTEEFNQYKPEGKRRDRDDAAVEARVLKTAAKAGFVSIEPVTRVERVRKKPAVQDSIYLRGPIEMTNAFKLFCNEEGLAYGEALGELMKRCKVWR